MVLLTPSLKKTKEVHFSSSAKLLLELNRLSPKAGDAACLAAVSESDRLRPRVSYVCILARGRHSCRVKKLPRYVSLSHARLRPLTIQYVELQCTCVSGEGGRV